MNANFFSTHHMYKNIIWIGKPSGNLYPYRIEDSNATYFMDKTDYDLYKQERRIHKLLVYSNVKMNKVLDAIEEYGFMKYCQGSNEK